MCFHKVMFLLIVRLIEALGRHDLNSNLACVEKYVLFGILAIRLLM